MWFISTIFGPVGFKGDENLMTYRLEDNGC